MSRICDASEGEDTGSPGEGGPDRKLISPALPRMAKGQILIWVAGGWSEAEEEKGDMGCGAEKFYFQM